jgi:rod shape-determining protein MreC
VAQSSRRSRRTLITVVVLILVSITLITFDERSGTHAVTSGIRSVAHDIFSPVVSAVNDILRPIGDLFAGSVHYGALQTENERLQQTIGRLRQQLAERPFEERELHALQALTNAAGLPFLNGLPTVTAQTTQIDVSNFESDITIDKGRSDGVDVGMPVVGAGGLVGQVTFASHHSATVELITDGQSAVGVTFGTNEATSILDGEGAGNPLSAQYIPVHTSLHKGEMMFTSGLAGGEFPSGIPVATVLASHSALGATFESVTATPVADLRELAFVDVIQWEASP